MAKYTVIVARVGEGEHQDPEFTVDAESVTLHPDGSLSIATDNVHSQHLGATLWGAFKVVRVPSAGGRI